MIKHSLLLSAILLFAGCSTSKKMKAQENDSTIKTNITQFVVGQGGGFTGQYDFYLVKKSGEVFLTDDSFQEISAYTTLDEKKTSMLFAMLEELHINMSDQNPPGNMNFSLVVFEEENRYTLSWADQNKPKKNILTFYEYAFSEIKNNYNPE